MGLFSRSSTVMPLDGVDTILADLDGVVYAGPGALPHAVESLNRTRQTARLGYITNNAARTDATVAAHLTELGLQTAPDEVVTSPQAAVRLLRTIIAPGSTVLVVGGEGLVFELEKAGYVGSPSAVGTRTGTRSRRVLRSSATRLHHPSRTPNAAWRSLCASSSRSRRRNTAPRATWAGR